MNRALVWTDRSSADLARSAAVSTVIVIAADGTYTTAPLATVVLPVFTPAVDRLYRLRATVYATEAGGGRVSRVIEATIVRGVSPVSQIVQIASGTDAAIEAIGSVVFTRSGNDVQISCTGVAALTLTWGAVVEVLDLPLA